MNDRLWRLLAACEALARRENAALAGRNFADLGKTQEMKAAILADLAAQATLVHASCDSRARARLTQLLESTRRNRQSLRRMMAKTAAEAQKIQTASNQLHTFRTAYSSGRGPQRQAFSAHG